MAFNINYLGRVSTSANRDAKKVWTYNGLSDGSNEAIATIAAAGYFNNMQQNLTSGSEKGPINVGDVFVIHATDANGMYVVSSITTNVTLTSFAAVSAIQNSQLAEDTIKYAEVTVSTAELLALATTPKELVAAAGAGKYHMFLGATFILDYATTQYTEAGDNLGIKYTDAAGVQVSDTIEMTGFIDQAADTITNAVPVKDAIVAAAAAVNQPLVLDNLGSNFAAGDSPVRVQVVYRTVTSGL